jgi:hypothetical protein
MSRVTIESSLTSESLRARDRPVRHAPALTSIGEIPETFWAPSISRTDHRRASSSLLLRNAECNRLSVWNAAVGRTERNVVAKNIALRYIVVGIRPAVSTSEMAEQRVTSAGKRRSWPRMTRGPSGDRDGRSGCLTRRRASHSGSPKSAWRLTRVAGGLRSIEASARSHEDVSVRAQNVLKGLAVEITGEQPPKETWSPPRNCFSR